MGLIDARIVYDTDGKNISEKLEGLSKVVNEYEWTTIEGQLVYILPEGTTYDPALKGFDVTVAGGSVPPSLIQKDNPNQFTLLMNASDIYTGMKVVARWIEPFISVIELEAHKTAHEVGGNDEIDITKLKNYNIMVDALQTENNKLNEISDKLSGFVSVLNFGADPTGATDSTQAFKDAIAAVRDHIIANNFKSARQVLIPGGIYKITDKLVISPFVHLKTQGMVIIESTVVDKSTIHFMPQASDPTFSVMAKQQYSRSPLINGAEGGMLIRSVLDKATNNTIALEIGGTTDLGDSKPMSRYSMTEVSIEHFKVGIDMGIYNNYIGSFYNLFLEDNGTNIRFGSVAGSVINSGENFTFYGCTFGQADICFDWFVDGMDCNFYGCSMDFNNILFNFRRGWKRIGVWGGHIETNNGHVIANSTAGFPYPQLFLSSPVVNFPGGTTLFKGQVELTCDGVRWEKRNHLYSHMYLCDNVVTVRETNFNFQGLTSILSPKLNQIADGSFSKYDLSGGNVAEPFKGFTVSEILNLTRPVLTSSIPAGSSYTRALKSTCTTDTNSYMRFNFPKVRIKPGDVVHAAFYLYIDGDTMKNQELYFSFYDIEGNLIEKTGLYTYRTGAKGREWSNIESARYSAPPGTHEVALGYYTSGYTLDQSIYIADMFFGIK